MKTTTTILLFSVLIIGLYSCSKSANKQQNSCGTVSNLKHSVWYDTASLSWDSVAGATSYKVKYRQLGAAWDSVVTSSNKVTIIQQGAEWRVQTICPSGSSAYSLIDTFLTGGEYGMDYSGTTHYFTDCSGVLFSTATNSGYQHAFDPTSSTSLDMVIAGTISGTYVMDNNPSHSSLAIYTNHGNYTCHNVKSRGSITMNIVDRLELSLIFTATLYNDQNANDSLVITNGSGPFAYSFK